MTGTPGHPVRLADAGPLLSRQVLDLPADPTAARSARRLLGGLVASAGLGPWAEPAELACTELVTNAVLHAHTAITVTVEVRADEVYVGVGDASPDLPQQREGGGQATTGRGMLLVARTTSEHGVRQDGPGKTVWFTLRPGRTGEPAETSVDDLLDQWADVEDLAAPGEETRTATEQPRPATEPDGSPVRLLGLPPTLWLAAEEHHRTLLRELVLYLAEHPSPGVDMVASDAARRLLGDAVSAAIEASRAAGTAQRPLPEDHPADLPAVPERLDIDLDVAPVTSGRFAALQDALDTAERLARAGDLLARPGLPEVVAVRDWACEQVLAQLGGAPAAPWSGTDHERFLGREDLPADATAWEVDVVRSSARAVVAADESNRIVAVSRAMADVVGWDVEDLVGRRVVTLIPARLRESHVAGFSRHLVTGEARLLGVPLELPVLRADGTEVRCAVLIEEVPAARGRRVYLASFEPVGP